MLTHFTCSQWQASADSPEHHFDSEREKEENTIEHLHSAGLVTDRLPGLGAGYRTALPLPQYENGPSVEAVNEDLGNGHRYVDDSEHRLWKAGINVASNNILVPETNGTQREFPYLDGIQDNMKVCTSPDTLLPDTGENP